MQEEEAAEKEKATKVGDSYDQTWDTVPASHRSKQNAKKQQRRDEEAAGHTIFGSKAPPGQEGGPRNHGRRWSMVDVKEGT